MQTIITLFVCVTKTQYTNLGCTPQLTRALCHRNDLMASGSAEMYAEDLMLAGITCRPHQLLDT
eukprot:scaffold24111_cov87-Cyclotella_meneghiniana.AAC.1